MDKVCEGCEYLKVLYKPMMPYELGRAECTKYKLITDFINMRKFGKLKCVEGNCKEVENDNKSWNNDLCWR